MRIDSSTIGMESARSYTSYSGGVTKYTVTTGRQSLEDGTDTLFGNSLGSDVEGEENQTNGEGSSLKSAFEELKSKVSLISSQNVQKVDTRTVEEQIRDIRQQCLYYLMRIFFPDRSKRLEWENNQTSQSLNPMLLAQSQLGSLSDAGDRTYTFTTQYYREESENTVFSTQGTVKCADGREINFNLNLQMSRSFQEYYEESISMRYEPQPNLCDPLVINLDGSIPQLSDQTFRFDLDGDGTEEKISRLNAGSGFLALDKNGDGTINNGSELFGTSSGNGFADLAAYETDKNGFIDEGDEIWDQLKIWVMEEDGSQRLYSLADKGVGAICLQNADTNFSLTGGENQVNGMVRRTGIFLYENGNVGTIQHVDMAMDVCG